MYFLLILTKTKRFSSVFPIQRRFSAIDSQKRINSIAYLIKWAGEVFPQLSAAFLCMDFEFIAFFEPAPLITEGLP